MYNLSKLAAWLRGKAGGLPQHYAGMVWVLDKYCLRQYKEVDCINNLKKLIAVTISRDIVRITSTRDTILSAFLHYTHDCIKSDLKLFIHLSDLQSLLQKLTFCNLI